VTLAEERMVRVAAWTGGLFGAGAIICQMYPTSWIEPVVLVGLGAAMLIVSARTGRPRSAGVPRRTASRPGAIAAAAAAAAAKEAPAA
jgi:uncharacterized membrane protein YdcZ (DUF606 family)